MSEANSVERTVRARFEAWASAPPQELDCSRHPTENNKAWPGQYKDYAVQLAWEAWEQATADERQECAAVCDELELGDGTNQDWNAGTLDCASAILARSNAELTDAKRSR